MENIMQKIVVSILLIPIIGFIIYSISESEKCFMFGRRWMFKNEEIEPSDQVIKINKVISYVALIVISVLYLYFIIS